MSDGQVGMALLSTVVECRRALSDHTEGPPFDGSFQMSRWSHLLSVDEIDDGVRLTFGVDVRWQPVDLPGAGNDLEYRIALEVSDSGCRVRSGLAAHLDLPFGAHPPGDHVLRDEQSKLLPFDEALAELKAQVAAYRGGRDPLLAPPPGSGRPVDPGDERRTREQS
jgi:hypothetical protein